MLLGSQGSSLRPVSIVAGLPLISSAKKRKGEDVDTGWIGKGEGKVCKEKEIHPEGGVAALNLICGYIPLVEENQRQAN